MKTVQTYKIKGMHCASCAGIIEKTLKKQEGVHSIEVNYGTETAKINFDDAHTSLAALSSTIAPLGYMFVDTAQTSTRRSLHEEKLKELSEMRRKVFSMIPLAIITLGVMGWEILGEFQIVPSMPFAVERFFRYLFPLMATYALFVVGKPYVQGFTRFVRHGTANMDTLIGLGTGTAYVYSFILNAFDETLLKSFPNVEYTYYDVTIVVIAFITLGKYIEARSKLKTGDAIEKILNLQAKTALIIRDGKETEVSIDQVVVGDLITVKPAGKIPVDGIVADGSSYVDESLVTGEPMPILKVAGSAVMAGTMNTSGSFSFTATKVGSETLLASIVRMVEDAQGSKAPIQGLADKISSIFVPIVLIIAFIALGVWVLVGSPYLGFSQALSYGLISFVGILVIACPCALGLATPTAIIVGVGKGAREGILMKDASTLEKLYKTTILVVDKTGTITKGKPEFVSFQNFSQKKDEDVIGILAALEKNSEHPIAHAVLEYAQAEGISMPSMSGFEALQGLGVKGTIGKTEYYAGNARLIAGLNLSFDTSSIEQASAEGKTPIMVATKEEVIGSVLVADAVKPGAADAVSRLHTMGIRVVMLTGDTQNTAEYIAQQVGIDEVVAHALPADKLTKIKELQSQGSIVAMAGDGVNDAPALAQADVGIAMATGTDVAIESAGITLLQGDISKLVKAITLSKLTMRGIKQNLFWAFIYNLVGIPLAAGILYPVFGWLLNPIFAGLAMAFSSVSVVGNSLRLKSQKL